MFWAVICGLALTVKATGIVMWPAIAYLIYVQFRDDWRQRLPQALAVVFVIGVVWEVGNWTQKLYWDPLGGGFNALRRWFIDTPVQLFTNMIGILGSPTKGVFIFAPVLLLSLYALPKSFRTHRDITIFALLITGLTVGFLSLLSSPYDEVWGPRYMHVTVAPLLVCIGAAWPRFQWRPHLPMVFLALVGLVVSLLGTFYYYGNRVNVAGLAGQNTMEWLTGDSVWNEIGFNARLFSIWIKGGTEPVLWTPAHIWVWTPPPNAPPWESIDLRGFSVPQSLLLSFWNAPADAATLLVFRICLFSMVVGPLSLFWVILRTMKVRRTANFDQAGRLDS
jgi:hypothetical protein